jgi:hypothetical protein
MEKARHDNNGTLVLPFPVVEGARGNFIGLIRSPLGG